MLKDIAIEYYNNHNYNCAECIIRAGNDYYDLKLHDHDMKMVAAFGKGIQVCDVCGTLTGAACLISSKYVETKAHETPKLPSITAKMIRAFEKHFKSRLCLEIRKTHFDKEVRCLHTVEEACDIIEEVIKEIDNKQ